jgi:hypothetical protein
MIRKIIPIILVSITLFTSVIFLGCVQPGESPTLITLVSISISKPPEKTGYAQGEAFNPTGLEITGYYSDGSYKVETGYTLSTVDTSTIGTKIVTVTLDGKTTSFSISVINGSESYLVSIAVTNLPTKTVYIQDEAFDPAGLVITGTYSDSSYKVETGYTLSTVDTSTTGTKTITVTLDEKTTSFEISVGTVALVSIAVTNVPVKTTYAQGEVFDPTGLVITGTYSDYSTKVETGYTVVPVDTGTTGTKTVTVTINGITTSFNITVNPATLVSITVTNLPAKTVYIQDEAFDPTGLVITGTYSDYSTKVETGYTLSTVDTSTTGTKTVTVTLDEKTTSFEISVGTVALVSIAVTNVPVKTTYAQDEDFDPTGLLITGTYTDSSTKTETVTVADISGYNAKTIGPQTLTVTVTVNGKTATATFTVTVASIPLAQWARTLSSGSTFSEFESIAVDASGNIYAAGSQFGLDIYTYGSGVSVKGSSYDSRYAVLVKYNSSGEAQWAKTVSAASSGLNGSSFDSITVDTSGNIYVAGSQSGTSTFDYGNGVSVAGANSSVVYERSSNAVLVKYNSSGEAQWAKTVSAASSVSSFNSITVDTLGNIYAAGYQNGSGTFNYGNGVNITGANSSDYNAVLVKYNSSGTPQWAKTVPNLSYYSQFYSIATDVSGNVYAAGVHGGNHVLVKYNFSGVPQWTKIGKSSGSSFNSVAVDTSGDIYVAGTQSGGTNDYGNSVSAPLTSNVADNIVLVKYTSSGDARWAKTVVAPSSTSVFKSVTVDASGNVYAAGYQNGNSIFNYGNGVSAQGISSYSSNNVLMVKYNSSGTAQWAKTVSSDSASRFYSVAVDASGNAYAAGYQWGKGIFNYGNEVSSQGSSYDSNVLMVKYR